MLPRMTRHLDLIFTSLLALSLSLPVHADDEGTFNTVRVEGRNYINLADFTRFYGFSKRSQQDKVITLRSRTRKLQLTLDSTQCRLNGITIWLNDAPMEHRSSVLLSETDVRKTLDPILRPWTIPRRRVKMVMIDPGHGGQDPGTHGRRTTEKFLALDLATRLDKRLRDAGFETLLTRRNDTFVSLEDRSDLANASDADIFVSIHFNTANTDDKPNPKPHGIETFCLTPVGVSSTNSIRRRLGLGDFSAEPGNRFDTQNMILAFLVQQRIMSILPSAEDRGIRRARFFVIKATERPSILVENGYLSNPAEEKRILSAKYRDTLAAGIVEGIKRYAKLMNREQE